MTTVALIRQFPAVHVGVATRTSLRQTQIRLVQILDRNRVPGNSRNVARLVASPAFQLGMFCLQAIARGRMIKFAKRHFPVNQGKRPAVMLIMALSTGTAGSVVSNERRMQTPIRLNPAPYIRVASLAFEFRRPLPRVVALGTTPGAAQCPVRIRQFSGRDLRHSQGRQDQDQYANSGEIFTRLPSLLYSAGKVHKTLSWLACSIDLGRCQRVLYTSEEGR
jgi:hypothetical protein